MHTVRPVHINNNFSIVFSLFVKKKKWNVNFSQPISKEDKTLQIGHEYIYFFKWQIIIFSLTGQGETGLREGG